MIKIIVLVLMALHIKSIWDNSEAYWEYLFNCNKSDALKRNLLESKEKFPDSYSKFSVSFSVLVFVLVMFI